MGFQTPQFFILTALAFCLFWRMPRSRLVILAVFNALFYLYAGALDLGLLLLAFVVTYLAARSMTGKRRKTALILGVGIDLLNLVFFKYYHFALQGVAGVIPVPETLNSLKVALPIGISFYTFQLIAYLVDAYRREVAPIKSPLEFWVFIAFFGQVIAGPIMRAKDFSGQVARTTRFVWDKEMFRSGLALFAVGLGKKIVFADTLSPLVDRYFSRGVAMSSIDVWIAACLFAFQIYYDFSAYSDMALGVGRFFGYDLTPNFDTPYLSRNPQEFWKRWHVTLSSWIRDYVYIPMGGSRKGFARGLVVLVVSMTISGLWHGASWNFVLWGLYHGLLSAGHRIWRKVLGHRAPGGPIPQIFSRLVFFLLTAVGWVLFRVTASEQLPRLLSKMLLMSDLGMGPHFLEYAVLIGGLYFLHWVEWFLRRGGSPLAMWWNTRTSPALRGLVYSAIITMLCVFLRPRVSAFIYFQF